MNRQVGGLKTSTYWRERAAEARTRSDKMLDLIARVTMLDIAQKTRPWRNAPRRERPVANVAVRPAREGARRGAVPRHGQRVGRAKNQVEEKRPIWVRR